MVIISLKNAAVLVAGACSLLPAVLSSIGSTAAGSLNAAWQSFIGNVSTGSLFSILLQSIGVPISFPHAVVIVLCVILSIVLFCVFIQNDVIREAFFVVLDKAYAYTSNFLQTFTDSFSKMLTNFIQLISKSLNFISSKIGQGIFELIGKVPNLRWGNAAGIFGLFC